MTQTSATDDGVDLRRQVHAVLHCNINTAALDQAVAYYTALGLPERMRSVSTDTDGRPMGLDEHTASVTAFHYDGRGPRSAPALELVGWQEPQVIARELRTDGRAAGFDRLGLRTPDPSAFVPADAPHATVVCRGAHVAARLITDPDGAPVEVIELDPAGLVDEPDGTKLSHVRMVSTDLDRTARWWGRLGFTPASDAPGGTLSLTVREDPTFSVEFTEDTDAVRPDWRANTQGLYRIALAVDDVTAAYESLVESGADVPEPVFIPMPDIPTGGFTVLFLADPDGAVVELVARPRSAVRRPAEPAGIPHPVEGSE
ncbi:VOC family protein [Gordonia hydrophobica]|uniref:VOC family protein n=1 Tax=Gordonia hydrophobica TaxID=40516 RepID=A0ABZ2U1W9_9ACTN|nr:VOC family protein [Gordonia hydrophobica]MBM7369224.1 catechol 2,3-dioxygenase-like lactoylglutathione lyase family enzyme [Gordonia hydrophobica]